MTTSPKYKLGTTEDLKTVLAQFLDHGEEVLSVAKGNLQDWRFAANFIASVLIGGALALLTFVEVPFSWLRLDILWLVFFIAAVIALERFRIGTFIFGATERKIVLVGLKNGTIAQKASYPLVDALPLMAVKKSSAGLIVKFGQPPRKFKFYDVPKGNLSQVEAIAGRAAPTGAEKAGGKLGRWVGSKLYGPKGR